MLKQVKTMPKKGHFTATWEIPSGNLRSETFHWSGSVLFIGDDSCPNEPIANSEYQLAISKKAVFFVSVSEYKKISFKKAWQVMRWLEKHEGEKLYMNDSGQSPYLEYHQGHYSLIDNDGKNGDGPITAIHISFFLNAYTMREEKPDAAPDDWYKHVCWANPVECNVSDNSIIDDKKATIVGFVEKSGGFKFYIDESGISWSNAVPVTK